MNEVVAPRCASRSSGDALACLQEERSGIRRAEEWCRCESLDGLRPFDGLDTAHVMGRLYSAATLRQFLSAVVQAQREAPRRGQGDQALSCSFDTLSARAGASKLTAAVKRRVSDQYRSPNPVALLAEIRAIQEELGNRADRRVGQARGLQPACTSTAPPSRETAAHDRLKSPLTIGEIRAVDHRFHRLRCSGSSLCILMSSIRFAESVNAMTPSSPML
ncbi:hypothetical protein [Bradyrhizobium sp. 153]|uniref:hypothetical protein n=1 Tax=Bradyrhizobium sp. 153 TaxID=2782627 RepID=UPI001FFB9A9F|nr:hypothetical protein [Bradyrhizobium sp. 153]MCK1666375.1 hypothetical protein [Bradyrhizobium sp. 153]